MRSAITWLVVGAVHAVAWLLWPAALDAPAWWICAAVTSLVLVSAAALVLPRRDLPTISLASAAGVTVGWASVALPSGDVSLEWSLAAIGVFVAAAVAAALLGGLIVGLRERRTAPPR
ncbi:hypothetical protein [Aeromicrobium phragmitis]|uniref:hypothetical protein n=1 Tax=Aeromicrobium phragmitis TaxID=2478914 RepID=UPI0014092B37|nr:hypothetical protein [Aeromicrobium phragmitis]